MHDEDDPAPDERSAVERWVLPYIEDSSLWPVLLVVVAALAAFMTPILLLAGRNLDLRAILVTGLLLVGSVRVVHWEWKARGRLGGVAVVLGIVWGLAVGASIYGARTGLL